MPQQQQKLLNEFQAALGKSQTAWSEQAKALAQQSLNTGLQAVQNSTALLFEEAARMNGGAVRKAFEEGVARMVQHSASICERPGAPACRPGRRIRMQRSCAERFWSRPFAGRLGRYPRLFRR